MTKMDRRNFLKLGAAVGVAGAAAATVKAAEKPKPHKYDTNHPWSGRYCVLWRNGGKSPGRILGGVKSPTDGSENVRNFAGEMLDKWPRMGYEILAGPDKGKQFDAFYDPLQNIVWYNNAVDCCRGALT